MSKKDNDGCLKILKYLEAQNRPYSVNDIFLNLHKDIGKTAVQKSLDQLVQNGSVKEKAYGKQKVYVISQDQFLPLYESELKERDTKITESTETLKQIQKEIQEAEVLLNSLGNSLTTEEAKEKIVLITAEVNHLEKKLDTLTNNPAAISQQEKEQIEYEHTKMVKEWRCRRRMAMDILDAILEGYPKSKAELYEEIGIESDQDVGVNFPQS